MNKIESCCYQKYKSSSNNSCVIKEKNIVGKNLLEGTYFDGNGVPKMIGITKAEYLEYKKLQQENEQLKIQISAREEKYSKLENNWNKLKKWLEKELGDRINPNKDKWLTGVYDAYRETIDKMQELEQGSDKDESDKDI